jgi:hypothetical protein
MTTYLGLDLSKRATGFAVWSDDQPRPFSGVWSLGSEITPAGRTFLNLHKELNGLYSVSPFDVVTYEKPLNLGPGAGFTNADTIFVLMGLAAHVDSFCEAKRVRRYRDVNNSTWRRHYIGAMKRGTKTIDLKDYAMRRCRELGLNPSKHDEAEAIGILDYSISLDGILPPWRADHVLTQQMGIR